MSTVLSDVAGAREHAEREADAAWVAPATQAVRRPKGVALSTSALVAAAFSLSAGLVQAPCGKARGPEAT